jgi:hypothetical protein
VLPIDAVELPDQCEPSALGEGCRAISISAMLGPSSHLGFRRLNALYDPSRDHGLRLWLADRRITPSRRHGKVPRHLSCPRLGIASGTSSALGASTNKQFALPEIQVANRREKRRSAATIP